MNTHNQEPIDTTKFSFPYLVIDIIVNNRRRIQQFPTFHNNFSSIDRMAHMEPAKWSTALPSISLRFFRQPKKGIEWHFVKFHIAMYCYLKNDVTEWNEEN